MNYENSSYRVILRDSITRMKKEHPARTLKWLAEKTAIQAPYLTNVLKERAHLSTDQLYSVLQLLEWDDDQRGFVSLLLEWERSSNPKRRQILRQRIDEIRKEKLQSKAHLKQEVISQSPEEFSRFFLNPFYSLIHAFIGVPRFAERPSRITQCLNLGSKRVQELIKELVDLGFLAPAKKGYVKTKRNFHLPKESPLCTPHLALMHDATSHHLQSLPDDEKYTFNATFSADP